MTAPANRSRPLQVLSFPPIVAPTKVLLVPLSTNPAFNPFVGKISKRLRQMGISSKVDASSASIGKRYSRNDELGTPLGVTIDFQTVKDGSLTLRDRDSMKQVRAGEDEILDAIKDIVEGKKSWSDVERALPAFTGQELEIEIRN
jgi:glycyl-tRNA synthetase